MSQASIKPHISTAEKLRARGLINETIKETRAAHGRAVAVRYGRFIFGVGFGIGAALMAVVWLFCNA